MEILGAVRRIQERLTKHDAALRQMIVLDQYIIQVNHLAFHYAINSCYVHVMRLMLRKSIAEGLRKMYKIYRLKQWFHTQNLVHQLSLRYQWHHGYNLLAQMDSIHREPDMTPMDKEDIAAQSWLIMEKEFYRGA